VSPGEILAEFRGLGIDLRRAGDCILYRPREKVPAELREALRLRKAEILLLLSAEEPEALRLYSRVLGEEVWLVLNDDIAKGLHKEGSSLPVFTLDEVIALNAMLAEDRRTILHALAQLKASKGQPTGPGGNVA
jgi:hypothetical protein